MRDEIIICKCNSTRFDERQNHFEVMCSNSLLQTYSGIYDFDTVMRVIDGYNPFKILIFCDGMHGSTIVNFIYAIQSKEYKLKIIRTNIRNDIGAYRIITLRFTVESKSISLGKSV